MHDINHLTDAWDERFAFFDTHGLPSSSPRARQAFKRLPWLTRMRIGFNPLAFFFGPFYFFAKGMWRKGVVLLGAAVALAATVMGLDAGETIDRAASLVIPAMAANTANYAYYLHVLMESRSWNPLEGFGRKRSHN